MSAVKDALILFVITLTAGLVLGSVWQLTAGPIAQAEAEAANDAYARVFQDAGEFEVMEVHTDVWAAGEYVGVEIDMVLRALGENGSSLGYVLQLTSHEGYGGDITFTMGIREDGTCNGISILDIAETPGLGMNAEELLVPQFDGKKVEMFNLTKGEAAAESQIDAISGATITSDAFVTAANAGLYYFQTALGGDGNES